MTPTERRDTIFFSILDNAHAFGYGGIDPMLILAQSALETANFTSRRIEEDNNAFGLKQPEQRPTMSIGPGAGGFATYATLNDSVLDYFMRQKYFNVSGASDAAYIATTMQPPYAYAEEGQAYIDAWLAKFGGTDPHDIAWTVGLAEFEFVHTRNSGLWIGLLLVAYVATQ